MRKEENVVARLAQALADDARIVLCPVVFYQIRRGLVKSSATGKLKDFDRLAGNLHWDDMQKGDWSKAAELWAQSQAQGASAKDDDILIASHALRHGAVLVTDNERHFRHLGIALENWCKL